MEPFPDESRTFTPTRAAPGATPARDGFPWPSPAMMLATWVPWPLSSEGVGPAAMKSAHPSTLPPSRSTCPSSIPLSITAQTTSAAL